MLLLLQGLLNLKMTTKTHASIRSRLLSNAGDRGQMAQAHFQAAFFKKKNKSLYK